MKFAYYAGCSLEGTALEYNLSTKEVCKTLGIELIDVPDWNCCGATSAHTTDHLLSVALPAMNLIKAGDLNLPLAIPCSACFNRFKTSVYYLKKDKKIKDEIKNIYEGKEYNENLEVNHILGIFSRDDINAIIASKIVKPLTSLKIAPYYGCLLVKPKNIMEYENPENPESMDNLITTLGGEPVSSFAYKTECCGASLSLTKDEIALKLIDNILDDAVLRGAECISVICPFCHFNLDAKQKEIEKKFNKDYKIPIFYFTQLTGLALGIHYKKLGIDKHFVPCKELLKKKELL